MVGRRKLGRWLVVLATAVALSGCASEIVREGLTDPALADRAMVADLPGARFWGDEVTSDFIGELRRRLPGMPRIAQDAATRNGRPVVEILALSGGGGDGAYGAGILAGWSRRGDRPEFEVVTGVSAGAIIAPFAFLGAKYDNALKEIWTQYQTSQIVTAQILPGIFGGASLGDATQLAQLIAKYADARLLREVANEYKRGRLLLIGTTNLDAQRPVVWNMGEIAASGHPHSLDLFRKVIMASAAIPGALPPVEIPVTVDGKRYDELHVDGGTTREVFVSPLNVPFRTYDVLYSKPPIRRIYVIKNGKASPEQQVVQAKTLSIVARSISTLIKNQNLGELYRIYRMAKDAKAEFHFTSIPSSFSVVAKEFFDPVYQTALFEEGKRLGLAGDHWIDKPPDLIAPR
ncbi:MAG: patatin-like phospholipase family protein [Hyphomicrobiaceae bacterium]|nr:patatin-like phospholipase family protein [Hyphomicrobiaceae bacterium]